LAAAAVVVLARKSKSVTLRSAEAARAVSGVVGRARARNGFSETVYIVDESQHNPAMCEKNI
jgi:hypothetical protein